MASNPALTIDLPAAAGAEPTRPSPDPRGHALTHPTAASSEYDATSHEGLRHALLAIADLGWESRPGQAVVDALRQRAGSWAFLVDRRCGRQPGSTDPADVVTVAWLTLAKFASRTAQAQRPWAYLWTAVGNELTRSAIAESHLTDPARVRGTTPGPVAVVRVGLESALLDASVDLRPDGGDVSTAQAPPSEAVVELALRISAEPCEVEFWLDAIGRALDVMAAARRSYEEYMLRRDPYMREVLRLTLDELSALSALLIGPRKGDRAAQSLLLALHRDLTVPTNSVVGAAGRISLLQARHRALGGLAAA